MDTPSHGGDDASSNRAEHSFLEHSFVPDPTTGGWSCPYCNLAPFHLRAPGSFSPERPSNDFVLQHFAHCFGLNAGQVGAVGQVLQQGHTPSYATDWLSHNPSSLPQDHQQALASSASPSLLHRYTAPIPCMTRSPAQKPSHHPSREGAVAVGMTPPSVEAKAAADSTSTPADIEDVAAAGVARSSLDSLSIADVVEPVMPVDRPLLTDYFYLLMEQLKFCRFNESDRNSRGRKREHLEIGYGGLECRHCAGQGGPSRKFFWANVDRIANSFSAIADHITRCRHCPIATKMALEGARVRHREQMARLPKGSQKVFFRRMWRRLHPNDESVPSADSFESAGSGSGPVSGSFKDDGASLESSPVRRRLSPTDADTSVLPQTSSPRVLAIPGDEQWLSDFDCFVRRSLEVFCASQVETTEALLETRQSVRIGQVGMRCVHCASSVGGTTGSAVLYPSSIKSIYESARQFQRLHLDGCPNLPAEERAKLISFQTSASLPSVLRSYYVIAAKALGMVDSPDGIYMQGGYAHQGTPPAQLDFQGSLREG